MPLANGLFALVDAAVFDDVNRWSWAYVKLGPYTNAIVTTWRGADTPSGVQSITLHRYIMKATSGQIVDHKSGDQFDNRKKNLRVADARQSSWNTKKKPGSASKYKGVIKYNGKGPPGRWVVRIRDGISRKHVGVFASEIEAAKAYDAAARRLHGKFACVNFPRKGERCALRGSE